MKSTESESIADDLPWESTESLDEKFRLAEESLEAADKRKMSEGDVDLANAQFALDHQDGADPMETMMMTMYMLGAMQYFDTLSKEKVQNIAFEIAKVGINGINPKNSYTLRNVPNKTFGGYQLLAWYYVSWARVHPEALKVLQLPFDKAYAQAMAIYNMQKGKK